jgi:hypothetical protein
MTTFLPLEKMHPLTGRSDETSTKNSMAGFLLTSISPLRSNPQFSACGHTYHCGKALSGKDGLGQELAFWSRRRSGVSLGIQEWGKQLIYVGPLFLSQNATENKDIY